MNELMEQIIAVLTVSLGFVSFGSILCFPSAIHSDVEKFGSTIYGSSIYLSPTEKDLVGSLVGLGALSGILLLPCIERFCRRKFLLISMGLTAIISWMGIALCPVVGGILFFRFSSGFFMGIVLITGANYNVEIGDPKIRGVFCCFVMFSTIVGQVYAATLNYWFHYYNVAILNCLIPALFLLGLLLVPEDPKYLILRDMDEGRSRIIFSRVRTSDYELSNERKTNLLYELKQPKILKRLLVTVTLLFIRSFGGFEIFICNSFQIFKLLGNNVEENLATIILFLTQLLSTVIFFFLWNNVGRRKCLFSSLLIVMLSLICLAVNSFLDDVNIRENNSATKENYNYGMRNETILRRGNLSFGDFAAQSYAVEATTTSFWSYLPTVSVLTCLVGFSIGLQSLPFIIMTEHFPTWVWPQAAAFTSCCYASFQFFSLQLFTPLVTSLTLSGYYLLLALVISFGIPFTHLFIKNKLEMM